MNEIRLKPIIGKLKRLEIALFFQKTASIEKKRVRFNLFKLTLGQEIIGKKGDRKNKLVNLKYWNEQRKIKQKVIQNRILTVLQRLNSTTKNQLSLVGQKVEKQIEYNINFKQTTYVPLNLNLNCENERM